MDKTNECLWCGLSEAMGAKLAARCASFGGRARFTCIDTKACDERICRRILFGPVVK